MLIIQSVSAVLLCPPIGLRGSLPEGFSSFTRMDLQRQGLCKESAADPSSLRNFPAVDQQFKSGVQYRVDDQGACRWNIRRLLVSNCCDFLRQV